VHDGLPMPTARLLTLILSASCLACSADTPDGRDANVSSQEPEGSEAFASSSPRYAYAANFDDNTISIYAIQSGFLRHVDYVGTGINPR